ncbi:MAG: response regulator [Luteitalea sp.]|nr:response regulator [Luteitalea sp.]
MHSVLRTLIVDDEPLARARLKRLLEAEPDVTIVGECRTSAEAVQAICREAPHILLLDIQMPEGDGFSVLQRMPSDLRPLPILVTAYSEHAVRAFDAQAFDYLLKPISAERLRASLDRARAQLAERRRLELSGALAHPHQEALPGPYADRLAVPAGPRIRFVPVNEVDFITAQANYAELHVGGTTYLVRETMSALEGRLDPRVFVRIHRSRMVRLNLIADIEPLASGQYVLRLKTGVRLTSGRSYRVRLRRALGLDDGRD